MVPTDSPRRPWLCLPCELVFSAEPLSDNPWTDAGRLNDLHRLFLTDKEVRLLAQALAVAAMDDLNGDLAALTASRASRIVWAHAHGPDSSPFRQALGPLATLLAEIEANG